MSVQGYIPALLGMKAATRGIGDGTHNIANANTPGFRGFVTEYSDLERGSGVVAETRYDFETKGPIMNTGITTNLAIEGRGMFAVQDAVTKEQKYTFNGQFVEDKDGNFKLIDRYQLLGWGYDKDGRLVQDLVPINVSATKPEKGSATTSINFAQINFDRKTVVEDGVADRYNPYDNFNNMAGGVISPDAEFDLQVYDSHGLSNGHVLRVGFKKLGTNWAMEVYLPKSNEMNNDTTGVGLLQASSFRFDTVGNLDTSSITSFPITGKAVSQVLNTTGGKVNEINNDLWSDKKAASPLGDGLFTLTVTPQGGTATTTKLNYGTEFTTLKGLADAINAHSNGSVKAKILEKPDPNNPNGLLYELQVYGHGGDTIAATGGVASYLGAQAATARSAEFPVLTNGKTIDIAWSKGINAQASSIKVNFDPQNFYDAAESNIIDINQVGGFLTGSLQSISINKEGIVEGVYSNNTRAKLYQIPLTVFNGELDPVGDDCYIPGAKSGQGKKVVAGEGGAGKILSKFIEGANVDYQNELPKIMEAQHAYKMSAKALQVNLGLNKTLEELL